MGWCVGYMELKSCGMVCWVYGAKVMWDGVWVYGAKDGVLSKIIMFIYLICFCADSKPSRRSG